MEKIYEEKSWTRYFAPTLKYFQFVVSVFWLNIFETMSNFDDAFFFQQVFH